MNLQPETQAAVYERFRAELELQAALVVTEAMRRIVAATASDLSAVRCLVFAAAESGLEPAAFAAAVWAWAAKVERLAAERKGS